MGKRVAVGIVSLLKGRALDERRASGQRRQSRTRNIISKEDCESIFRGVICGEPEESLAARRDGRDDVPRIKLGHVGLGDEFLLVTVSIRMDSLFGVPNRHVGGATSGGHNGAEGRNFIGKVLLRQHELAVGVLADRVHFRRGAVGQHGRHAHNGAGRVPGQCAVPEKAMTLALGSFPALQMFGLVSFSNFV